ncbi:MAG: EAL domain-containing protein [Desulfococcaceae bacterium]
MERPSGKLFEPVRRGGAVAGPVRSLLSDRMLEWIHQAISGEAVGIFSIRFTAVRKLSGERGPAETAELLETILAAIPAALETAFPGRSGYPAEIASPDECFAAAGLRGIGADRLGEGTAVFRRELERRLTSEFFEEEAPPLRVGCGVVSPASDVGFFPALYEALADARTVDVAARAPFPDSRLGENFRDLLDGDRLESVFQPIVQLSSGRIHGWEAFVRGPRESPFHRPGALFAFAEETGQVWTLDRACRRAAVRDFGEFSGDKRLFLNVHLHSFSDPGLIEELAPAAGQLPGLDPAHVVLEFSERFDTVDRELFLRNLDRYRDRGYRVAIDDFSRSTLRFISEIRPDYVKLDPSLIRGLGHDPVRRAMVEGMAALSERIGARVTAVGIETETEFRALAEAGVRYGQGHFIHRPERPRLEKEMRLPSQLRLEWGEAARREATPIRDLAESALQVTPDTAVARVKEMLEERPPLSSVIVAEAGRVRGLVMSHHMDRQLGTQYGVALYSKRPVSLLMDAEPLVFSADQPLGEAAQAAINREGDRVYDDVVIVEDGAILGTVSVQRMLETLARHEIRARKDAEAATRAKSAFLANMSHDIRTPMNAILGMADLLWDSSLTDEQRKFVRVFRNAGENLLELINDILDLSKVEADRIELESVPFRPREVLERTCEVMAIKAHEKAVELVGVIDPALPARLVGDPGRLRQILSNLVGNAVKFTRSGEIVVRMRRVEAPEGGKPGVWVHASVRDTGVGIPRDKIERVFETFAQAHSSTSREFGGTGLGLTICKRLAEMMDGRVWVESEPGEGSDFQILIRLDDAGEAPEPPPLDLAGTRLMLAMENRAAREALAETLTAWGAAVFSAARGEAVEAELDGDNPADALLLDRNLADGDGYAWAAHLAERPGVAGRIVMLSPSHRVGGDMARGREIGVAGTVVKPPKASDLARALGAALGRTAPEADTAAGGKAAEAIRPLRVLLAEDNENNRTLFRFYLKDSPHAVTMVENGRECVDRVAGGAEAFDLVFMDIDMPIMDGYAAAAAIRRWEAENGRPPLPIVALTAHALKGKRQESLDAGCTDHLTKPFRREQLFEMFRRYGDPPSDSPPDPTEAGALPEPERGSDDGVSDGQGTAAKIVGSPPRRDGPLVRIPAELRELIPGFMEVTRAEIDRLDAAAGEGDYAIIQRMGHRIKGAALCYGFERMGDMAREIEDAGRDARPLESVRGLAGRLRNYLETVRVEYAAGEGEEP